jgi:hypothetical protein
MRDANEGPIGSISARAAALSRRCREVRAQMQTRHIAIERTDTNTCTNATVASMRPPTVHELGRHGGLSELADKQEAPSFRERWNQVGTADEGGGAHQATKSASPISRTRECRRRCFSRDLRRSPCPPCHRSLKRAVLMPRAATRGRAETVSNRPLPAQTTERQPCPSAVPHSSGTPFERNTPPVLRVA